MNMRSMLKNALTVVAPVALVGLMSTSAMAGPVTYAGESIGLALGAALPEGWYFVDVHSQLFRENTKGLNATVNIPILAWSTPWTFMGGRIEAYGAAPWTSVSPGGSGAAGAQAMYNPALLVGEAWALGGGFHFSQFFGGYAPARGNILDTNAWVFNSRSALTYLNNGWDLTAHVIYGVVGDDLVTHAKGTDYLNVDLTAVKTIGKWEVGPVAYVTTDTSGPTGAAMTNRIAAGAMVGYNFPGISVATIITHDVETDNLNNERDTRLIAHFVVPLQ
jgi:Putative MetA-pathway of phenol degradation